MRLIAIQYLNRLTALVFSFHDHFSSLLSYCILYICIHCISLYNLLYCCFLLPSSFASFFIFYLVYLVIVYICTICTSLFSKCNDQTMPQSCNFQTVRDNTKQSDWPLPGKIAPHLHRIQLFPTFTVQTHDTVTSDAIF